jgi:hypothetical protein
MKEKRAAGIDADDTDKKKTKTAAEKLGALVVGTETCPTAAGVTVTATRVAADAARGRGLFLLHERRLPGLDFTCAFSATSSMTTSDHTQGVV